MRHDRKSLKANLLWIALCLGGIPGSVGAQQVPPPPTPPDTSVILLDPLLVQSARPVVTPGGTSALVARPETLPIAPAPSLEDVLRALPMIQVRRNSRGEAQMSLRGSRERSMAVLLDGVPVSIGWDHRADLSVIPVAGAREVTLIRGMNSLLHGPNVLGGVVKVDLARVRTGSSSPLLDQFSGTPQLQFGIDGTGGVQGQLLTAHRFEGAWPTLLRAGVTARARDDLPLPGGLSRSHDLEDHENLENSDLREVSAFVALRTEGEGGGWLSLSSSASSGVRGVLPELNVANPRYFRQTESHRIVTALSGGQLGDGLFSRSGGVEGALGLDLGSGRLVSYQNRFYDAVTGEESGDDRVLSGRVTVRQDLGAGVGFAFAATVADVHRDETMRPAATTFTYGQQLRSLAVELLREGGVASIPWMALGGGVVWDVAETHSAGPFEGGLDPLSAFGGRLGVSALMGDTHGMRLHASVGRRARFPSLREMYSGALDRFEPNPELRPETLTGVEFGITSRPYGVAVQFVAFDQRLDDAVVRTGLGGGRFRRENRESVRATGVEGMGTWEGSRLSMTADLTLQRVTLSDPLQIGTSLRAEYQPQVTGRIQAGFKLPSAVVAGLSTRGVGAQWCTHADRGASTRLSGSVTSDAQLSRSGQIPPTWWGGARRTPVGVTLAIDNLLDGTNWDQCGLPQPGRMIRLQFRIGTLVGPSAT